MNSYKKIPEDEDHPKSHLVSRIILAIFLALQLISAVLFTTYFIYAAFDFYSIFTRHHFSYTNIVKVFVLLAAALIWITTIMLSFIAIVCRRRLFMIPHFIFSVIWTTIFVIHTMNIYETIQNAIQDSTGFMKLFTYIVILITTLIAEIVCFVLLK